MSAESITCPRCGRTSWHPKDIEEGYCARCHDWTAPWTPEAQMRVNWQGITPNGEVIKVVEDEADPWEILTSGGDPVRPDG